MERLTPEREKELVDVYEYEYAMEFVREIDALRKELGEAQQAAIEIAPLDACHLNFARGMPLLEAINAARESEGKK